MTRALLAAICLLSLCAGASAQTLFEQGTQKWLDRQYREAIELLSAFRKEPHGRSAEVDYMIGTSACRLDSHRAWGADVLRWLLHTYAITPASRRLAQAEYDACSQTQDDVPAPMPANVPIMTAGVSSRAKEYYWLDKSTPALGYSPNRTRELEQRTFTERLVHRGASPRELTERLRALPQGFVTRTSDHFIIASASRHSRADLDELVSRLEGFLRFMISTYQFRQPEHFITIYLLPSTDQMKRLADRLHGLEVSAATIGYSFRDDLSVISLTPRNIYGTVLHEVTHLLIGADFGDAPPWLNEGLASLYETTSRRNRNTDFKGLPNWRGGLIETKHFDEYTIENLIKKSWLAANPIDRNTDPLESEAPGNQMIYFATARYFLLYLQDQDKLSAIYSDIRNYSSSDRFRGDPADVVAMVERAFARPIAEVDKGFRAWLERKRLTGQPRPARNYRKNRGIELWERAPGR